jgi:Uma2 family endonuclease
MTRPNLEFADNATVLLLDDTEPRPDVCLFRTGPGATAHLTDEGYIAGTPDLVIEVAASSASYDLHDKKEAYRRAGIPEYLVWRTLDHAFHWFRLTGGDYVEALPDARGLIASATFPGLHLNVRRLLAGDYAGAIRGKSEGGETK